ncbi:MAG: GGDEF domain-containing protein [Gammaproteobacteria bacterium]
MIELYVEPLWYQTYGMRTFFIALALLIAWVIYLIACRRYRLRQRRLEELVGDRTLALREALGEVEKISRTDALTQVSNRRHFEQRLREVWAQAVELRQPVGVMMIDIDYFKQYNDVAGHQAGDECLVTVAQMLAKNVRGNDFVARYGGEEFIVLLVSSDVEATRIVGQRIQSSIRELGLKHPGRPQGSVVTVSAGFATASPGHIESPEELIKRADEALYKAKENGRDCIVVDGEWAKTG